MPAAQTRTGNRQGLRRPPHSSGFRPSSWTWSQGSAKGRRRGIMGRRGRVLRAQTQSRLLLGGPLWMYDWQRETYWVRVEHTVYLDRPDECEYIVPLVVMVPHFVLPGRPRQRISLEYDHARLVALIRWRSRLAALTDWGIAVPLFVVHGHPHPQR